jgi:hypothetical protein
MSQSSSLSTTNVSQMTGKRFNSFMIDDILGDVKVCGESSESISESSTSLPTELESHETMFERRLDECLARVQGEINLNLPSFCLQSNVPTDSDEADETEIDVLNSSQDNRKFGECIVDSSRIERPDDVWLLAPQTSHWLYSKGVQSLTNSITVEQTDEPEVSQDHLQRSLSCPNVSIETTCGSQSTVSADSVTSISGCGDSYEEDNVFSASNPFDCSSLASMNVACATSAVGPKRTSAFAVNGDTLTRNDNQTLIASLPIYSDPAIYAHLMQSWSHFKTFFPKQF